MQFIKAVFLVEAYPASQGEASGFRIVLPVVSALIDLESGG